MKGRICLVTGATAGIGKATARDLAARGATVVLVARDRKKGDAAVAEIRAATGNDAVSLLECDFASQASIRRLAAAYRERFDRLHVLVNNAGAIQGERRLTEDGLESTFAINHVGYFLLTTLLLDVLRASAPARIVNVASAIHMGAKLDLDQVAKVASSYSPMGAYGTSKLANVLFSAELARRLEGQGVTSNALHPGVVSTSFGDSGEGWMRFGLKIVRPFLIGPEEGAATSIHLASSPEVEGVTGKYFAKKKVARVDRRADDHALRAGLWELSERLVAASHPSTP